MTFFGFLYDCALHIYALFSLHKLRKERLGVAFPKVDKEGEKLIWIHAVSMGETRAVIPLVKRMKKRNPNVKILLTTVTRTGHVEGQKNCPEADWHAYLPFDFSYLIRPLVKRIAPDLMILVETDFWYNFQDAAKKVGAQLVVVNGKISERSYKRLLKLPFLTNKLLQPIDHFYLQGPLYQKRFQELGIAFEKLTVTGNLKLNLPDPEQPLLDLAPAGSFILTLGSTHNPEEAIWLEALQTLWSKHPQLKVLLVPRHPERFETVSQLLQSKNIPFSRWSQGGSLHQHKLLLVDAMGELRRCYAHSDLAFVAGSFAPKVGGHNIIEPLFFNTPLLYGGHIHAQPDLHDLVTSYRAGLQISPSQIISTLNDLLSTPKKLDDLKNHGKRLIAQSVGAVERTDNFLLEKGHLW